MDIIRIDELADINTQAIVTLESGKHAFDYTKYEYITGVTGQLGSIRVQMRLEMWNREHTDTAYYLGAMFFKTKEDAIEFKLWW